MWFISCRKILETLASCYMILQDGSSTEGYAGRFDVFMDALKKKEFNKLVLSRSQKVNVPLLFSPATAFYEAC